MSGWMVKVSDRAEPTSVRFFAAAESSPTAALVAVLRMAKLKPSKDRIQTSGQLSDQTLARLKIKPGQVRDVL
ncbi:hypothetical protein SAMN05444161_6592 [Rhizobiales bacterium GAS191]|nr:hypothetical protein SAMN05519104_4452 [Rhizobiales bacterium GAS188]SEE66258.1 hypothetical protein SAMN05444161_6592 [Rhizobiales bacterium GAS191]